MPTLIKTQTWRVKIVAGGRGAAGWGLSAIPALVVALRRSSPLYSSRQPLSPSAPSLLPAPYGGDIPIQLCPHIHFHRYHVATINRFWNQVSCDFQLLSLGRLKLGPAAEQFFNRNLFNSAPAEQGNVSAVCMAIYRPHGRVCIAVSANKRST